MSAALLEQQRREFAEKLGNLQSQAGKIPDLEQAITDLQVQFRTLGEAQIAANQPRPSGSERELEVYTRSFQPGGVEQALKNHNTRKAYRVHKDHGPVRMFTAVNEFGYAEPGLADDIAPRTEWQVELQGLVTKRSIVKQQLRKSPGAGMPATPVCDAELLFHLRNGPDSIARIFADTNDLDSWFPDTIAPTLTRDAELAPRLGSIFPTFEAPPGGSIKHRHKSKRLIAYKHALPTNNDPANDPLSSNTPSDKTIDLVSQVVGTQIDRESDENSVRFYSSQIAEELMWALIACEDNAIINGDGAAAHQDAIASWNQRSLWGDDEVAAMGGTNDHRKYWTGLRARAFDVSNTTDQNGAQTAAGAIAARAKLAVAHAMAGDVVFVVSPEYFLGKMLGFTDFITWDKVGPNATVLTGLLGQSAGPLPGQVGYIAGVPVIVNWFLTGDLASTGLYTGSGSTTGMLVLSRGRFERWVRKAIMVESQVDIRNNTMTTVARKSDTYRSIDGAGVKNVHFSINLTY